jgi:ankyrin repeat protein
LEAGADPDDNESVYHAAQFNRREILELLKRYGANLSGSFDEWGNTPLYFNCGHLPGGNGSSSAMKGVEWLLQNGANPNIPSYDCQETPLHLVSKNGWGSDVIRMFLEAGANPDLVDAQGWRAIDWATWVGNSPAMEVLREVGQEVNSSIPNWYVEAAQGNLPENAKLQDISEPMQGQVLRKLAETGNVRGMNVLLQLGFSARSADDKGVTPLHWACYRGNSAQVRLLLAAGADWRTQEANYDGTPMDWAVHGMTFQPSSPSSYPDVIDALILEGASTAPIERMAANPDLTESQRRRLEAFLS